MKNNLKKKEQTMKRNKKLWNNKDNYLRDSFKNKKDKKKRKEK